MKLYREVPPEIETKWSLHRYIGIWSDPMYKCSLEEIKITEEEKQAEADKHRRGSAAYHGFKEGVRWALSKLKGDE